VITGPYSGRTITFATMHGKEQLASEPFHTTLGANVIAPLGLDTDQWGTFAGDVPRTMQPHDAARTKVRQGMQLAGTTLGLASEGSFRTTFGAIVENMELLLFVDDDLGMELVEGTITTSPILGGRRIHSADEALDYARAVGFPGQGVIVQSTVDNQLAAHKNLSDFQHLEETVTALLGAQASVLMLPDYRAHRSPTRAQTIRQLCTQMARRLATECPECRAPGFGHVDVEHGVPCESCHTPTRLIAADIHGCAACTKRARIPRGQGRADPQWCDLCNP
jgi:hypothetical protein